MFATAEELNAALHAAEQEVLQEKWDKHLVVSYVRTPGHSLPYVIQAFMRSAVVDDMAKVFALKRTPHEWMFEDHKLRRLNPFIASYLPRIFKYLTDHPEVLHSEDARNEAARKITASKIETAEVSIHAAARAREKKMKKEEHDREYHSRILAGISSGVYQKTLRGNQWGVCK